MIPTWLSVVLMAMMLAIDVAWFWLMFRRTPEPIGEAVCLDCFVDHAHRHPYRGGPRTTRDSDPQDLGPEKLSH